MSFQTITGFVAVHTGSAIKTGKAQCTILENAGVLDWKTLSGHHAFGTKK